MTSPMCEMRIGSREIANAAPDASSASDDRRKARAPRLVVPRQAVGDNQISENRSA